MTTKGEAICLGIALMVSPRLSYAAKRHGDVLETNSYPVHS